ncbi:MAG: autotransporter-associated beta strand repeat-containing protein [Verrucomicrobiota bacterium]
MKTTRTIFPFLAAYFLGHAGATTLYWDANSTAPESGNVGGTWTTAAGNWNANPAGSGPDANFNAGDSVVFSAGTDGVDDMTVTISGTVTTPSILLKEPTLVTLAEGTIDITGGSTFDTSVLGAVTGRSLPWNSVITGTGGLTLKAHGSTADSGGGSNSELALSGTNDFTGTVTVTTGLVWLGSGFGAAANPVLLNGGGLVDENQNLTSNRGIRIGSAGGVVRSGSTSTTTLTGAISNAPGVATAALRHTEGGTLRLAGAGSGFTGTITNARGELQITAPNANWATTVFNLDLNGGNLTFNGGGTASASLISVANKNTLIESGTILDIPAYSIIPTASNGQAALIGGSAATDGMITSSSGTLTLTNGQFASGAMGSNGNIVYATIANPNGSTNLQLSKFNNNDLQLARANTYSGGTVINAGRVNATNAGGFGTGTVTVKTGAQAYLSVAGGTYANAFDLTGPGVVDGATDKGALRLATATVSGSITVAAAGARIGVTTGSSGKLAGSLLGSGPLEINSSGSGLNGTVSLNGSGSGYSGTLTVAQGRFNFKSSLGGSVIVAPTATATSLGGGTSITGNLTLNSTTKAVTYINSNGTLAVGGNLTLTGTNLVSLAKPAPGATSVTLMTYGGTLAGTAANLALENAASYRGTPVFDLSTSGQVKITGLNGQNLTWSGASGAWDIETSTNWNSGAATFSFGDAVTFNDAGVTKAITMGVALEPQAVTVNNSAGNDYTFSGAGGLAGSMGLTKSGAGTLTLGGTNSYSGAISVSGGQLKMGSQSAFGTSSGITISSGGQVDINGQVPGNSNTGTNGYTYTIAGNGGDGTGAIVNTGVSVDSKAAVKTLALSADASLGTATRFDVGTDAKAGIGSVNGAGFTLTKKGAGDVYFRGPASNFRLVVEAGRAVAMDTNLAFGGASGAVTVNSGCELSTSGARTIATPVTLNNGAILSNVSPEIGIWTGVLTATGSFNVNTTGGDLAIQGGIAGNGTLTMNGGNTLVLDGASNPFTGKIIMNGGALRAASDAALGAAPASLTPDSITLIGSGLRGGTAAGAGSAAIGHPNRGIATTGNCTWDPGAGNTLTLNSPITGSGSMATAGNSGAVVFNQPVSLSGNFSVLTGNASFNGGLALAGTGEVIVDAGGTANFTAAANPTTLRMRMGTANIGTGAAITTPHFITSDAGQAVSTVNQSGGSVTVTGTDNTNTTAASFFIGHWASPGSTYNLSGGTITSPGAVLSLGWDNSNVNFNQSGGTANLLGISLNNGRGNAATYTLTGGRLNLGANGINAQAGKTMIWDGGTVGAYADWTCAQAVTLSHTVSDTTIDTLDSANGTTPRTIQLTGVLSGGGGLIQSGGGAINLTAVNTYTGTTTVNAGTFTLADNAGLQFIIGNNHANNKITGAGVATINGDFTLDLTGAAIVNGNTWSLVDTTTKTFGTTFTIAGFTETANVHTMVVDGQTWTFTESTGVLSLAVAGGAVGYDSWLANYPGLPLDQRGAGADYDGDGLKNLLEYTLGGSPLASDAAGLTGIRSGGNFVVTFKRSDLSETDTTLVLQYGTNLAGWTDIPIGASPGAGMVAIGEDSPTADLDTVTVTIPTGGAAKFFAHLKVIKP